MNMDHLVKETVKDARRAIRDIIRDNSCLMNPRDAEAFKQQVWSELAEFAYLESPL